MLKRLYRLAIFAAGFVAGRALRPPAKPRNEAMWCWHGAVIASPGAHIIDCCHEAIEIAREHGAGLKQREALDPCCDPDPTYFSFSHNGTEVIVYRDSTVAELVQQWLEKRNPC